MPSLKPFFPVGLSGHFQPDRLLDNPVGDGVTQDGIGENFAPVLLGKLGREDRREAFDPPIDEIIHILHLLGSQCAKSKVVQNQDRHAGQLFQEVKGATLSPGERELFKETVDREEDYPVLQNLSLKSPCLFPPQGSLFHFLLGGYFTFPIDRRLGCFSLDARSLPTGTPGSGSGRADGER